MGWKITVMWDGTPDEGDSFRGASTPMCQNSGIVHICFEQFPTSASFLWNFSGINIWCRLSDFSGRVVVFRLMPLLYWVSKVLSDSQWGRTKCSDLGKSICLHPCPFELHHIKHCNIQALQIVGKKKEKRILFILGSTGAAFHVVSSNLFSSSY